MMELAEKILRLKDYTGEDEVVTSFDIKHEIAKLPSPVKFNSNIPILDEVIDGFEGGELIAISGPRKSGKCHGKGTKILMFDGRIKNVEDILTGDELMGDDDLPRKVLSITSGYDILYDVIQSNGDSYSVNQEHILVLKRRQGKRYRNDNKLKVKRARKDRRGETREIAVKDYIEQSDTFKNLFIGCKKAVSFNSKTIKIEPYLLGLWLGDGDSNNPTFTSADIEIVDYLKTYANTNNYKLSTKLQPGNKSKVYRLCEKTQKGRIGRKSKNRLIEYLKYYDLLNNKHIPFQYKTNNRKIRLQILAGLIDTDGHRVKGRNSFEIIQKNKELSEDIVFIARSCGFRSNIVPVEKTINDRKFRGIYYRVYISGNLKHIPCLLKNNIYKNSPKNSLYGGIKIKPKGHGAYYGFTLNGNGRYLLADFTITHNTLLAQTFTDSFYHQSVASLWFSFELTPRQFIQRFPELPVFVMPKKLKAYALDWLQDRIIEAVAKYSISAVFIDHLHFLFDMARSRNPSIEIGQIIRFLKTLAIELNLVIFIMCHTKKINPVQNDISDEDIRDSSFISQESDCGMIIWRIKDSEDSDKVDRACLKVCYHRRTGIWEKTIRLQKVRGLLREIHY